MSWLLVDGKFALGLTCGGVTALLSLIGFEIIDLPMLGDRAILGAIVGGFLAGIFGIVTALISIVHSSAEANRELEARNEVLFHSIMAKLLDLNDVLMKNRRHFMTHDLSTRVFFGTQEGHSFSKPLEGMLRHIEFSIEERTHLLRKKGAEFFNKISDMQGISDSFHFLHEKHRLAYYELFEEVQEGDTERSGYHLTDAIDRNSPRLMAMMDIDGALWSLLEGAVPEVNAFLQEIIAASNDLTSARLSYASTDTPPSAENTKRVVY